MTQLTKSVEAGSPSAVNQSDGWIEWAGGECPVPPETMVLVRYRNGDEEREASEADEFGSLWDDDGFFWDIIAYRVLA